MTRLSDEGFGYVPDFVFCGPEEKPVGLRADAEGGTVELVIVRVRMVNKGKPYVKEVKGELCLCQDRKGVDVETRVPMTPEQARRLSEGFEIAAEWAEKD